MTIRFCAAVLVSFALSSVAHGAVLHRRREHLSQVLDAMLNSPPPVMNAAGVDKLINTPIHNARQGYYDPHNHYSGIISWNGIGLATDAGKNAMDQVFKDKHAVLETFKAAHCTKEAQKTQAQQTQTRWDSRAPFKDELQLYVYQFLHSGRVCGVYICKDNADTKAAALCVLMQETSFKVNVALATILTAPDVFKTDTAIIYPAKHSWYESMMLLPNLLCLKNLLEDEKITDAIDVTTPAGKAKVILGSVRVCMTKLVPGNSCGGRAGKPDARALVCLRVCVCVCVCV